MIEFKQLKYFVVCADAGSFSKAAEILYTTQPNVSKAIKSMEKNLGFELFERTTRGIFLSTRGRQIYEHACRTLESLEQLTAYTKTEKVEQLLISCNPSTWFADKFACFYNKYHVDNLQFRLYSGSVEEIIKRVADYLDEIGFVYIMKNQSTAFQYVLDRKHLKFVELTRTQAMLYLGEKHPQYGAENIDQINIEQLKLVQSYTDEFALNNYWNLETDDQYEFSRIKNVVITNSDCVMEQLLQTTDLANISSGYLTNRTKTWGVTGIPVQETERNILFGYIQREQEELSDYSNCFVEYIKSQINISAKHADLE